MMTHVRLMVQTLRSVPEDSKLDPGKILGWEWSPFHNVKRWRVPNSRGYYSDTGATRLSTHLRGILDRKVPMCRGVRQRR